MLRLQRSLASSLAHNRRLFGATSTFFSKTISYRLADIGEGIREVQVLKVSVKPGDVLNEFDNICEVQSDKATVDISSRYSGVVKKVYIDTGFIAKVGEPLVDIELSADIAEGKPANREHKTLPQPAVNAGKTVAVKLTDIGEGICEVQVLSVAVKVGDRIEEMDKICEVQSDKATVDITSRYSGMVQHVYITEGTQALVGQKLIDVMLDGEASPALAHRTPTTTPAVPAAVAHPVGVTEGDGKVLATPATRYHAKLHNVDLSMVPATGKGGRVTKEDVIGFLQGGGAAVAAPFSAPATETAPSSPVAAMTTVCSGISANEGDVVVPITGVRRAMVKSMTAAAAIQTFSFSEEFELSALMALRSGMRDSVKHRTAGRLGLSFMPFFVKACSMALQDFPEINAYCPHDGSVLIRKKSHNIGFAMDTPSGLIVPVIREVQMKSVFEIAQQLDHLIEKGKRSRFSTADLGEGTFTLSNIGAIGGKYTTPAILPPQVGIAAMGRMQTLPRFDDKGNVVKANIMMVSFTADHRVVDGATMVRFANTWKRYIEQPGNMVLDLR